MVSSQSRGLTTKKLPKRNDPRLRLNTLCPYFTMFPLGFPFDRLKRAQPSDWVLDPFCGRGTTNFAARLRGLPSVGIDSNGVATAIANAKIVNPQPTEVIDLCRQILLDGQTEVSIPTGEFWSLCYDPKTLQEIVQMRRYFLKSCKSDTEIALRTLMLGILHGPKSKSQPSYLSSQMPRTYATKPGAAVRYWKKHGHVPEYVSTASLVARRAIFSLSDIPESREGQILRGDSRNVDLGHFSKCFSWVITSPPYFGMRTYGPDQWIRNWFLGGPDFVDYRIEDQFGGSRSEFTKQLADVWKNIAGACHTGARLIIRFGALPSMQSDARRIMKDSLHQSNVGWILKTIRSAGLATKGQRQAHQIGISSKPLEEFDGFAVLEA